MIQCLFRRVFVKFFVICCLLWLFWFWLLWECMLAHFTVDEFLDSVFVVIFVEWVVVFVVSVVVVRVVVVVFAA